MSRPPVRDEEALLRAHERRIRLLERRLAAAGYAPPHEVQYAGTTVERDAFYGVPATNAERVALANRFPTWWNTDLGWEEAYYATDGLAGLTAVDRLVAGVGSGWFPTGPGPVAWMRPSAGASAAAGSYVGGWNGTTFRKGGAAWFTLTSTGIVMQKPGRYQLSAFTIQQSGAGVARYSLRLLNAAGVAVLAGRSHGAEPLQASPTLTPGEYQYEAITDAVTQLLLYVDAGALSVHQTAESNGVRGQIKSEYLGPPLVSN